MTMLVSNIKSIEPMYHLPEGLVCPSCKDGNLCRLNVVEESAEQWIVDVECVECLLHFEYVGETGLRVRIPKRSHPAVDSI